MITQKSKLELYSESKGILENVSEYTNNTNEALRIFNFNSSNLFDSVDIFDEQKRKLNVDSTLINNGHDKLFSIHLMDSIPKGNKFQLTAKMNFSLKLLNQLLIKKEGIYFLSVKDNPGTNCRLNYTVKIPSSFHFVHVIGRTPNQITSDSCTWNLTLKDNEYLNETLIFVKNHE